MYMGEVVGLKARENDRNLGRLIVNCFNYVEEKSLRQETFKGYCRSVAKLRKEELGS